MDINILREDIYNQIAILTKNLATDTVNIDLVKHQLSDLNTNIGQFKSSMDNYSNNLLHIINTKKYKNLDEVHQMSEQEKRYGADYRWFLESFSKMEKKVKIEDEINKYKNHCDGMIEAINKIRASLVLGNGNLLELSETIKAIGIELKGLDEEANQLITDIDEFKKNAFGQTTSMSVTDIRKAMKSLKDRLKTLKVSQIDKYNAQVASMNNRIADLRKLTDVTPEVAEMIAKLSDLSICDARVVNYKDVRYLDNIDYNKLVETDKLIREIEKRNGLVKPDKVNLEDDIKYIETKIDEVDYYIQPEMTQFSFDMLNQDVDLISNNICEFEVKLENNKDKMSEEEYNNYLSRIEACKLDLYDLTNKLKKVIIIEDTKENNCYKNWQRTLDKASNDVYNTKLLMETLKGKVVEDASKVFENNLNTLSTNLEDYKKAIEQDYKNGLLDDVQFTNLNNKIAEIEKDISDSKDMLKNPDMFKETDVFAFLNGEIDGLEKAIDALDKQIESLDKPIKDKETRKKIDACIKELEKQIKLIREHLENHKDDNPEKYEATVKRLDEQEKRLEEINKKYRKKCPLRVRAWKSAKEFYKKHKKVVLIAAGLAAIALIHATVGPVIIPAIMHGNIMIESSLPALKGIMVGINNILGKLINANLSKGIWSLANGVTINPSVASASLLKGIAISGLSTAILTAPAIAALVASIKAISNKMTKAQLKERVSKIPSNVKTTVKNGVDKGKNTVKEKVGNLRKKSDPYVDLKEKLECYKEYEKSGLSLDEFAKENNLSKDYVRFLKKMEGIDLTGDISLEKEEEITEDAGRSR